MNNNHKPSDKFVRFPSEVYDALLVSDITMRELKVVFLIARLTYGCHRDWCPLIQADLQAIGIGQNHAHDVLKRLILRDYVQVKAKCFRLNVEELIKMAGVQRLDSVGRLVGLSLAQTSRNGNTKVPKVGSSYLPKEEYSTSRSGNIDDVPNGELSRSNASQITAPKDSLKTSENSVKEINADPNSFTPSNETEDAAQRAWQRLEPGKPQSFGFYLNAARKGLSVTEFDRFVSEIKSDPTITNPGAVFVKKYLLSKVGT